MRTVTLYSSLPETTQLACAFQGLKRQGLRLQLRPIQELGAPRPAPAPPEPGSPAAAYEATCVRLAEIGEQLSAYEADPRLLDAGQHQGLLFERDSLLARKRGLESRPRQKGGVGRD